MVVLGDNRETSIGLLHRVAQGPLSYGPDFAEYGILAHVVCRVPEKLMNMS